MKPLIVANWKMNPLSLEAAQRLADTVKKGLQDVTNVETVLCPPFVWLAGVNKEIKNNKISLGAQNLFWKGLGAYTGEISARMLKNLGCAYVIVGHSERRKILGETNEMINLKLETALKAGLKPIFCIGETMQEKQQEETAEIITDQLQESLKDISGLKLRHLSIAYEPIWAIGSGQPANSNDIMTARLLIQKTLTNLYSDITAQRIKILYGGSVTSSNAKVYIKEAGMNGLLIGGASLNATEFINIVKSVDKIC